MSIPEAACAAVFLDRDGVLIEDTGLRARAAAMRLLPGVPEALRRLREAGYKLVVVTNQPVIARGLASEDDVRQVHAEIQRRLVWLGASVDAWHCCPHHPNANVPRYRVDCDCRKPAPGMLLAAAREQGIDLGRSFMVGDRLTDIAAGAAAGCRTVWVRTGMHLAPRIETNRPLEADLRPDYECDGLPAAVDWIVAASGREGSGEPLPLDCGRVQRKSA